MEELFDILDEKGNKTGKVKERSKVHADGDWHRSVHIWIMNDKNELLLQRRSKNKDSDPNMLDISCAGHLTTGDDSIKGALRELEEELSLKVSDKDLTYITTLKRSPKHNDGFIDNEFDDVYFLKINKTIDELKYQEEEISEIKFVSIKELKQMIKNKQPDLVIYDDEYKILFDFIKKI